MAWILVHGSIPDGKFILHRCDNPPCFDVLHLYPGDAAQNVEDMMQRGRHQTQRVSEATPLTRRE